MANSVSCLNKISNNHDLRTDMLLLQMIFKYILTLSMPMDTYHLAFSLIGCLLINQSINQKTQNNGPSDVPHIVKQAVGGVREPS